MPVARSENLADRLWLFILSWRVAINRYCFWNIKVGHALIDSEAVLAAHEPKRHSQIKERISDFLTAKKTRGLKAKKKFTAGELFKIHTCIISYCVYYSKVKLTKHVSAWILDLQVYCFANNAFVSLKYYSMGVEALFEIWVSSRLRAQNLGVKKD